MKKLISVLLVVLMVAALSVSAFAYNINSPTAAVNAAQGTVSELDHSIVAALNWTSVDAIQAFVEANGLTGKLENPEELVFSNAFDFTPSDSLKAGDTVTFYDANIKAGKRVVVLHYTNDAWQIVVDGTAEKEGEVSFTYESASPYAILVDGTAAQTGAAQATGTQSAAVKSDKTGDMPYELILLGGMMFFGAVTVITLKRREG